MPEQSPRELQVAVELNRLLASMLVALKALGIQLGAKSTSATAGALTLPAAPATFITITCADGTSYKVPGYNA